VQNEQTRELFDWSTAKAFGRTANRTGIRGRTDVQNRGTARHDQRQAPLSSDRRRRQRLRNRDAKPVGLLFLGAALDDRHVRELQGHLTQERALAPVRLEKRHLSIRQGRRQRDARGAASGADVNDRTPIPTHYLERGEALVDMDARGIRAIPNRGQTRCRKKSV
jgi:hypothetical protein